MRTVVAYGPEILALENYFSGENVIINGVQRYFTAIHGNIYCNFTSATHRWMNARKFEIDEEFVPTFLDLYPKSYVETSISISEQPTHPIEEGATTSISKNPPTKPYTTPDEIAYTLFENLKLSISPQFAYKFALSTHADLDQSKQNTITSYYTKLDEIDLHTLRKEIFQGE